MLQEYRNKEGQKGKQKEGQKIKEKRKKNEKDREIKRKKKDVSSNIEIFIKYNLPEH